MYNGCQAAWQSQVRPSSLPAASSSGQGLKVHLFPSSAGDWPNHRALSENVDKDKIENPLEPLNPLWGQH